MRRVLIDECINPRLAARLGGALSDASVETVRELGWVGLKDHQLVSRMQGRFDVFVTIDKGFEFEHNLSKLSFGVIVLEAANNQMPAYEKLLEELIERIAGVKPGQLRRVGPRHRGGS